MPVNSHKPVSDEYHYENQRRLESSYNSAEIAVRNLAISKAHNKIVVLVSTIKRERHHSFNLN
jgi:hypothetical protein